MGASAESIRVGEIYCVAAHPYLRWTVVSVAAEAGTVANVTLRSSADPGVERVIAAPVLCNPARFTRVATA